MVDAVRLLATAQRLIEENGRSVTLVSFDDTMQDASRPWQGPADPRTVPSATLDVDAVFVDPSSARQLGISVSVEDLVKRYAKIMIMAPGADVSLASYQEVLDGTDRAKITLIETLRPGSTTFVHFVGVLR